jgi:DNA-binding NtrC family response regulator
LLKPVEFELAEQVRDARAGAGTILLVEDEDLLREAAQEYLCDCGYEVVPAANGHEALQVLESMIHKVDLLITDVVMPRIGGFALAQEALRVRPGLRILMMSGYNSGEVGNAPAFPLLRKPFSLALLGKTVREMFEKS